MLVHEDLVGGVSDGSIEVPMPDFCDAVEGGSEHHQQRGGDGLDDNGAATALEPIQCDDHQLPRRSFEEEARDHEHFPEYHRVQKLQHFVFLFVR